MDGLLVGGKIVSAANVKWVDCTRIIVQYANAWCIQEAAMTGGRAVAG